MAQVAHFLKRHSASGMAKLVFWSSKYKTRTECPIVFHDELRVFENAFFPSMHQTRIYFRMQSQSKMLFIAVYLQISPMY